MEKRLLIIFAVVAIAISCKKEIVVPNNGIYRGTFREISSGGDTLAEGVVHLALFEESGSFVVSGDSTSNAPATHGGIFVVHGATTMTFTNQSSIDTLYDIDHYLDTTYTYKFDDVNFELKQAWEGKTYEYLLVRN